MEDYTFTKRVASRELHEDCIDNEKIRFRKVVCGRLHLPNGKNPKATRYTCKLGSVVIVEDTLDRKQVAKMEAHYSRGELDVGDVQFRLSYGTHTIKNRKGGYSIGKESRKLFLGTNYDQEDPFALTSQWNGNRGESYCLELNKKGAEQNLLWKLFVDSGNTMMAARNFLFDDPREKRVKNPNTWEICLNKALTLTTKKQSEDSLKRLKNRVFDPQTKPTMSHKRTQFDLMDVNGGIWRHTIAENYSRPRVSIIPHGDGEQHIDDENDENGNGGDGTTNSIWVMNALSDSILTITLNPKVYGKMDYADESADLESILSLDLDIESI